METLKELIQIASKIKVDKIEVLGIPKEKKTKAYLLYEGITEGRFTTDEEAAINLYAKGPEHQSYLNLKVQLKKKLLDTILFIDNSREQFYEYQRIQYNVSRKWTAINILISRGKYGLCVPFLKQLLTQSLKIELTWLNIEILRVLRYYHGTYKFDDKMFEYYDRLLNTQNSLREKELDIEGKYLRITQQYILQRVSNNTLIKTYRKYSSGIEKHIVKSNSSKIIGQAGLIKIGDLLNSYNFKDALIICDKVISILERKTIVKVPVVEIILFQKIVCLTQLKKYEEGKIAINKLFGYLKLGSFNWFKGQEMKFFLMTHTQNYQEAYEVFQEVYTHRQFKKVLGEANLETWEIFRAYLHLLKDLEIINIPDTDTYFKKFRIQKFINEVPVFSKDKQGANIAILVIQIVFSIQQKKYDQMIDRSDAIAKYASRHLKKDDNFRSNVFIKMLLEIPKASFHQAAVERKVGKYLKRLSEVPLEVASQTHSIEVIPYEDLWPMVIGMLENKRRWGERG